MRIYAIYNKNRTLAIFNALAYTGEMISVFVILNVGFGNSISCVWNTLDLESALMWTFNLRFRHASYWESDGLLWSRPPLSLLSLGSWCLFLL